MIRSRTSPSGRSRRASLGMVLAVLVGTSACPKEPPPPAPPPEEPAPTAPDVQQIGTEIFDAWFAAQPVTATSYGNHDHDGAWPGLAPADIEADRQRIDEALARVDGTDTALLGAEGKLDLDILRNALQLQRFEHEVEQPWLRNPLWYAGIIGSGLEDLVSRDYAPVEQRAQATVARLEGLPALVDQAIENLQPGQTMAPHTEVARRQLDGVLTLIDEIPERLAGAQAATLDRVTAASGPAREAIARLQAHVDVLLPEASAPWRLGKEAFERKLALTLHTDLRADEIRRLAMLEHGQVRKQMAKLAGELADVLFTSYRKRTILRLASGDPETAIVAAVLQELSDDRVTPPQLRDRVEANLTRLDAFVRERGLVTLDDDEVLEVIWTPPHQRGVAIAGLAAPGPLDAVAKPGLPSFYLVQPVPEDWAESERVSFLREYNNFMIEILSIHEAIPGHFVQLYYGKREPSIVRKVLANGPFVEGWAVYAERFMVEAGYAGAAPEGAPPPGLSRRLWTVMSDPELRAKAIALHGLKFYLRTVTNAILDHSIHAGDMDELAALELMVFRSFQQEGEAKAKWVRAQVTSTQLSTYFVGAQAWFRLRKQAEAQARAAGETFDLQAFHDAALSHGAPPVHRLPELMAAPPASVSAPQGEPAETVEGEDPSEPIDEATSPEDDAAEPEPAPEPYDPNARP